MSACAKKRGAVGAESIKAPKDKESSDFKCWCKYGAEVVQVGAVVVFIIIYLYLFLLIINSYLYISIFSSKIDFFSLRIFGLIIRGLPYFLLLARVAKEWKSAE